MHDAEGCSEPNCFKCKLVSLQFTPSAMPSRKNDIPPRKPNNSWEKGIVRDSKGAPVHLNGKAIGLKELADNRHKIERQLRERREAGLAGVRPT